MDWQLVSTTHLGDSVLCDVCNEEWGNRPESGGFLFGSKAYCPDCAKKHIDSIRSYGEEHYITARCPQDMSFATWVHLLRDGDDTIKLFTVE